MPEMGFHLTDAWSAGVWAGLIRPGISYLFSKRWGFNNEWHRNALNNGIFGDGQELKSGAVCRKVIVF